MLAHYLVANVGYKVAPHRFQIAGWWPLIFHPKACCLQSGPYKVALINHNACSYEGMTTPSIHSRGHFVYKHVDIYFLAGGQATAVE